MKTSTEPNKHILFVLDDLANPSKYTQEQKDANAESAAVTADEAIRAAAKAIRATWAVPDAAAVTAHATAHATARAAAEAIRAAAEAIRAARAVTPTNNTHVRGETI